MGDAATGALHDTFEWLDGGMELAFAADRATRLSDVYGALASVACDLTGCRSSAVYMADAQDVLRIRGWSGVGQRLVRVINDHRPMSLAVQTGEAAPAVRAFRRLSPVWVADVATDPGCGPWAAAFAAEGVRSTLGVSLGAGDQVFGVLECYSAEPPEPTAEKLALLGRLAKIGGFAIDIVSRRLQGEQQMLELEAANRKLTLQVEWRERAQSTEAQLMEVLLEDQSLEALARVLAESLECTAVVEEVGVLHPHTAVAGAELVPDAAAALLEGKVSARGQGPHPAGRPTVISNDLSTGMPGGLAAPALLSGELAGWVSAYRAQPFDRFERRTVQRAALVMAALAQRQRAEREVEWRLSREFFDQLLDTGAGSDTTAVVERGLHLGVDLRQSNVILVFRTEHDEADGIGAAALANARTTRLITSVQRAVDVSSSRAMAIARADHVVVLYPAEPEDEVDRLITRLQDELRAVRVLQRLTIVVSTVCRDPVDYEPTYRAALTALSLRRPGSDGGVVRVPDLGVYTLLLNARRPDELAEFAAKTVAGLRRYDEDNSTELVHTLRVYLEERGKLAATASRLFVHANTVSYRLGRIRELTGGHPSELDFALRFELAFMIERLMGQTPR